MRMKFKVFPLIMTGAITLGLNHLTACSSGSSNQAGTDGNEDPLKDDDSTPADQSILQSSSFKIVKQIDDSLVCSGVLIQRPRPEVADHSDILLTAGHCFRTLFDGNYQDKFKILAEHAVIGPQGERFALDDVEGFPFVAYRDDQGIRQLEEGFDIAVIKLEQYANYSPVRMVDPEFDLEQAMTRGVSLLSAGFGYQDNAGGGQKGQYKEHEVPFRSFMGNYNNEIHGGDYSSIACEGDSGGGLFVKLNENAQLLGILSRFYLAEGFEPCGPSDGNVWTSLLNSDLRQVLNDTILSLQGGDAPDPEKYIILPAKVQAEMYSSAQDKDPENWGEEEFGIFENAKKGYGVDLCQRSNTEGEPTWVVCFAEENEWLFFKSAYITEAGSFSLRGLGSVDCTASAELIVRIEQQGQVKDYTLTFDSNSLRKLDDLFEVKLDDSIDLQKGIASISIGFTKGHMNLDWIELH